MKFLILGLRQFAFSLILIFLGSSVLFASSNKKLNPLMKDLIKKEYLYLSEISQNQWVLGERLVLSNKVMKGGYNVAGKPILIRLLKQGDHFDQNWKIFDKKRWIYDPDLSRQQNDEMKLHHFREISDDLFDAEDVISNRKLTDYLGEANFSFKLTNQGSYTLAIFFLNSQDFYSEHVNFLSFRVVDPQRLNWVFIFPFLLIVVVSLFLLAFRLFSRKSYLFEVTFFPSLLIFTKQNDPLDMDLRKWSLLLAGKVLILSFLAWVLNQSVEIYVVLIVGLLTLRNFNFVIVVLEALILWAFYQFLLEFNVERVLYLLDKNFLLTISLISLFFSSFPLLFAFFLLAWLYHQTVYDSLIYFVMASFLGSYFCFFLKLNFFKKENSFFREDLINR